MNAQTNNIGGAFFIILSMFFFVTNDGFMKSLSGELAWHQVVALRGILGTLLLFGLAVVFDGWRSPREILGYLRHRPCVLRVLFEVLALSIWIVAVMNMSLAGATAINQLLAVFLTLGGALVFGERIGLYRLSATIVSFVGVLLIVKPGSESFTVFALVALLATMLMAARDIATRALSQTIPSTYVAAISMAALCAFGFTFAATSTWPPLSLQILLRIAGAAVSMSLAFLFAVMGARIGEVSFLAPFRYAALVGGLLIAVVFFDERPDALSLVGASIIVAAGLYILHRENRISLNDKR